MFLIFSGCIEDEIIDDNKVSEGTLRLQITDKPTNLEIINANVTISMVQVHKSNSSVVEEEEEEEFDNIDELDDDFIAEGNGPYKGDVGEDIQFLGDATGGEEPYNWSWDFGDGAISYEEDPIHNFSAEGVFTVNLTVTDQDGNGVIDWYLTTANIGVDEDDESEAGWYTIVEESQEFDLIAIQNATELMGEKNLSEGKYTQIRLTIDKAIIRINNSGEIEEHTLKIPSNKIKLIKPFYVYENETTILTLDFDIHESVHKTGSDKYILKPTIKVIQE
jgi:hypothetical protein